MRLLIVSLLFSPLICLGAISSKENSLKKIREELGVKTTKARQIAAGIHSLENEIGKVNSRYLDRARKNQSLGKMVATLQQSLEGKALELAEQERLTRKYLRMRALESGDDMDENALLKKTLLENLAKKRLKELSGLKLKTKELQATFQTYQRQLEEARTDEENLYSLIVDLENKKKDLSKEYVSSVENKNELEEKLEYALAKRKAYKVVKPVLRPVNLIPPIENFVTYKGGKKGVTFKYEARTPVKASAGGKVVYSGELASYGKVIMLDHGAEVRSVILGDIQIRVKKGDQVVQGQIIGYTLAEPGLKKSLYYEVRKKNVAQNTLEWLENKQQIANI